jgi:dethiobiotin synthetase
MNIFVTGTGTGIGKTVISSVLAEALQADYWKPVQAGYKDGTDSEWVKSVLSNDKSIVHPEVYKLILPASPHIAARQENIVIEPDKILHALPKADNLIIEGAGGLMVPLHDNYFVADLIKLLEARVVIVSKNTLGSINHSLLTAMACKQKGLRVLGWIFNGEYLDYEDEIVEWSGYNKLGSVPFAETPDSKFIAARAAIMEKQFYNWPW